MHNARWVSILNLDDTLVHDFHEKVGREFPKLATRISLIYLSTRWSFAQLERPASVMEINGGNAYG